MRTYNVHFDPIQDEPFLGCSRMGRREGGGRAQKLPLPKIYDTYSAMMKLVTVIPYLEKIQNIFESRKTPFKFC